MTYGVGAFKGNFKFRRSLKEHVISINLYTVLYSVVHFNEKMNHRLLVNRLVVPRLPRNPSHLQGLESYKC